MTTITASTTVGVVLTTADYSNPVVIAAGVTISNGPDSYAVYGSHSSTGYFVIQNDGAIISPRGISLVSGGLVTNEAAGVIDAATEAVRIAGAAGTVVNDGSITGTAEVVGLTAGGSVTNAASASLTAVNEAIGIGGTAGVVFNGGSISSGNVGVLLSAGGSVTNAASGSITAGGVGVGVFGIAGTLVNDGSIHGANAGVDLRAGGLVTNAAGASIVGTVYGIDSTGVAANVVNAGRIAATGTAGQGIVLYSGGSITNAASASITGGTLGVYLSNGGTLTNAGTIGGGTGPAVMFAGETSNLLVLDPGYVFFGVVLGSDIASNTLELASAASAGAVSGLGTGFTYFGPIVFDAGAKWSISGDTAGLAGTISGFAAGDTIVVTGVTETGSTFSGAILTLDESGGSATLDLPGTFTAASDFHVGLVPGGTEVTVACFRAGTRIACPDGERAVEDLIAGELVRIAGGESAAITWIGHRRIDCARHPMPEDVWPVRIRAEAFGPGAPHRELWLSPDHAVFMDGVLIPIRYLINGRTIVQEQVEQATYYHVELRAHAVILAEGLPCETYLDTGNRAAFAYRNGADVPLYGRRIVSMRPRIIASAEKCLPHPPSLRPPPAPQSPPSAR